MAVLFNIRNRRLLFVCMHNSLAVLRLGNTHDVGEADNVGTSFWKADRSGSAGHCGRARAPEFSCRSSAYQNVSGLAPPLRTPSPPLRPLLHLQDPFVNRIESDARIRRASLRHSSSLPASDCGMLVHVPTKP